METPVPTAIVCLATHSESTILVLSRRSPDVSLKSSCCHLGLFRSKVCSLVGIEFRNPYLQAT